MKKNISIVILAILTVCIALTGCQNSNKSSGAAKENKTTAVFADTQCPTNLDPAVSWNSWYTSRYGITETLYKLDDQLVAQPFLAKSCEMENSTVWKITLRDDVTFQNGKKLTADSVKKSWERTMKINARFNELLFISSLEADGQVLIVKTSTPVPAFLSSIAEPLTGVIDADSEKNAETDPVGTGPFIADGYVVKSKANVKRNDNYWGGKPALESVTFNIIASTNALSMAQQTGESDLSVSMPSTSLELFSDKTKYNVDGVAGSRGQVIFMNYNNQFIKDINVRKAISMSIDKKGYANILNKGASVPANGLFPDFMTFGGSELKGYAYDLNGAKQLLIQAGYKDTDGDGIVEKDGKKLSLRIVTYSTKAELPVFCEELSSRLKEIGIELKVDVYESVATQQKNGDFDLMLISFTMTPTGDPQYFCDIAFKTNGSSNYGHYSNSEVDSLIDKLDQEFDQKKRIEYSKQIQQKILDDAGYIVIGHAKFINVMSVNLKNVKTNPSEYYLLNNKAVITSK